MIAPIVITARSEEDLAISGGVVAAIEAMSSHIEHVGGLPMSVSKEGGHFYIAAKIPDDDHLRETMVVVASSLFASMERFQQEQT